MTRLALPFLGFLIYCAVAASAFQAGHIHRHHPQRQPRGGSTTSQSPVEASLPSSSETHARSTGMGKTRLYAAKKKSKAADVETLRKKELVGMVSESTGLPKSQVETVISGLLDSIVETVADGNKVNFVGFGSFVPRSRAARMGRNPKTGEEMKIKASNNVGFTAGKAFKDRLNE
eukprot:CAMPEP_0113501534 /NCGR_PEP_ID=MMETSP0014_2-20120614/33011_1 /TAXON_ID=2857 /ORGANISM="Nitzschia sp." /LENGTH=174 /DNA_ID=CAMNT_0000396139 /DNA_START=29 /DNA_END=553 /DNA_ORIENTATION=- /assembly_acc=CAM_ASM_000159